LQSLPAIIASQRFLHIKQKQMQEMRCCFGAIKSRGKD
jgi:hypothetical protein